MNSLYRCLFCCVLLIFVSGEHSDKKRKDIRDYTDADIERLYEEWEENDDEELPDDEKPEHLRPKPKLDLEQLKQMSSSPEDLMKLSKKGQSVMMFVSVIDPSSEATTKAFANKMSKLWQSMLSNNHVDVQVYAIEDDRLLFMFKDGSQAWESRDFLVQQKECKDVTLEGKTTQGLGSRNEKEEL
ncbi:chaperone for wingless signaling and trafficking of LDL receptor domain-containing protein [Ditylenchus destructor]|uniref:Chaperone for wingless signaling and trafficking of LDL receptor domain-containing protein n=1 Tax=Ditylenchus destructor TaxID=166010 RepID=A0AAD4RA93_9BILA|nr:chaperone for wingless signaling and trafficking of LDL receptor domain-containing protein [Ditylenchus destructor]